MDDSHFHVIRGSHSRPNTPTERAKERSMGLVPLPERVRVDLKAGDAVACPSLPHYTPARCHGA